MLGEGVQGGVGRGVVALAGAADDTHDGGEEDEGREVLVHGQFVQVTGRGRLGGEHGVEALGGERGDHAVVEHARRMDDGGEPYAGEELRERVAVGGVAGGEGDVGAQLGELGGEFLRTRSAGAAAADQEQTAGTVLGDQVARDKAAQRAGGAGDQDRALRVEGRRQGQDDLADVTCLADVAERLGCPADVPGAERQRSQGARREQPQDGRERSAIRSVGSWSRSKKR
ncbi:hypothetical protein STANM309S_04121 [Streptomyces tanashiensis]